MENTYSLRLLLRQAVYKNDVERVQDLLDRVVKTRVNVNHLDANDGVYLHGAIFENRTEIVQILLDCPSVDVNKKNKRNGETPLHQAIGSGNIKILEAVLAHPNININKKNTREKTPLRYAAEVERVDIIKKLLDKRADIGDSKEQQYLFDQALKLNDEPLLIDLIASGLDTQPDHKTDWLDKISDPDLRDRIKAAQSNFNQKVRPLL